MPESEPGVRSQLHLFLEDGATAQCRHERAVRRDDTICLAVLCSEFQKKVHVRYLAPGGHSSGASEQLQPGSLATVSSSPP